jgi:sarcosine oxidase
MRKFDVAIIGGGVMGAATALELAGCGLTVALIDQGTLPNPEGASVDHSKVFRFAYPDPFYVKLAVESLKRWQSLEQRTGAKLMTETGLVLLGMEHGSFETESYLALRASNLFAELFDSVRLTEQYPQFNPNAFAIGVCDPSGRILHAAACVGAMLELARGQGVAILDSHRVRRVSAMAGGGVSIAFESNAIVCDKAVVAAGPWSRRLLAELNPILTTTRQEIVYFEPERKSAPRFEPSTFPMFIELSSGFYGFPIHYNGAVKIANHHKAERADPYSFDRKVRQEFIDECRLFFERFIPELADARVVETRVCLYNNTPDDDFIVDWHPDIEGLLIVTGFSGHGFKFGPAIGAIAAQMLVSGYSDYEIARFKLSRFQNGDEVN